MPSLFALPRLKHAPVREALASRRAAAAAGEKRAVGEGAEGEKRNVHTRKKVLGEVSIMASESRRLSS